MRSTTVSASRPNRLLVALAAAWMILSLAIGSAVSAQPAPEASSAVQAVADEAARR